MNYKFIKIGFLLCLMIGNYFSYSQDQVKFGYFNKNHKIEVKSSKQTNSINNTKKDTSISILQQLFSKKQLTLNQITKNRAVEIPFLYIHIIFFISFLNSTFSSFGQNILLPF